LTSPVLSAVHEPTGWQSSWRHLYCLLYLNLQVGNHRHVTCIVYSTCCGLSHLTQFALASVHATWSRGHWSRGHQVTLLPCYTLVQFAINNDLTITGQTSRKHLNGFWWNLEYITTSWVWPHMQIYVALWQRGWSGWTRDMSHVQFLRIPLKCFFTLFFGSRRAAPVDRLWPPLHHTRRFRARKCLLGVSFKLLPILGVKSQKKTFFWCVNRHFKLNMQNMEACILSKLLYRLQTDFAVAETTKCPLWVVQTRPRWRTTVMLKNRKMVTSLERCDRLAQNLVKISNF